MRDRKQKIEDVLVHGLSHILRRTTEVNSGDQLALAQEYKEWISCISSSDLSMQEILVIDKQIFTNKE